ncbi:MAG: response regulator transcription factor [Acidobacteria bacterium]|nr:response regulator transcription factor [Acidobacteriota bacterium]
MRILVVEDDLSLREGLLELLSTAGHQPEGVADGTLATERGLAEAWDLVLLDLMLPGRDGVDVCRRLREARPGMPILMLTARAGEDDVVRGLNAGADDYVTKPFGARELLARIVSVTRRLAREPGDPEVLESDGCEMDLARHVARRGGVAVALTPKETGILRWLYRHRAATVTRKDLLVNVWNVSGDLTTRTVDVTIANLRAKIERDSRKPRIVVAVKGAGYAWGGG